MSSDRFGCRESRQSRVELLRQPKNVWGIYGERLNTVTHYQALTATGACEAINRNNKLQPGGHSHNAEIDGSSPPGILLSD